jgi:hypothetical protein
LQIVRQNQIGSLVIVVSALEPAAADSGGSLAKLDRGGHGSICPKLSHPRRSCGDVRRCSIERSAAQTVSKWTRNPAAVPKRDAATSKSAASADRLPSELIGVTTYYATIFTEDRARLAIPQKSCCN